jgi:hypothetical protein
MTPKEKLMRAVRRLIRAEIDNAWKGGGHPDDIPYIEHELKSATAAYRKLMKELTIEQKPIKGEKS